MKYFLSICTAIAILGCGTNNDYKAGDGGVSNSNTPNKPEEPTKPNTPSKPEESTKPNTPSKPEESTKPNPPSKPTETGYKDKGGRSGIVYIKNMTREKTDSKVCFDINLNGKCDSGEPSEIVYDGGKYSFEKSVSQNYANSVLLAVIKQGESVGYLTSYENNITPYTTLVVNETIYNPNANNDKNQAKELLKKKFNLDLLNGKIDSNEDSIKLYDTFQRAIKADNRLYNAIANAVDSIYLEDKLDPNNISTNLQKEANKLSGTQLSLTDLGKSVTWDKNYKDEKFMGVAYSQKNIINYSRWHNSLHVINSNSTDLLKSDTFLHVSGGRDDIDAKTGASEQYLQKVAQNDNGDIFALITKSGKNYKNGLGIYKANINNFTEIKYADTSKGESFYSLENGNDLAINQSTLVVGAKNGIKVFENLNLSNVKSENNVGDIESVAIVKDYIYASLSIKGASKIIVYDYNLNEIASINLNELLSKTGSLYAKKIVSFEGKIYFILQDSDFTGLDKMVYVYELKNSTLSVQKKLPLEGGATNLSLSKDGKYLLVTTWDKKLKVFNTNDFSSKSADLNEVSRGAFMVNSQISVTYKNSFGFYKLDSIVSGFTQIDKDNWTNEHRK